MGKRIWLVHFMAERGEGEYFALLEQGEEFDEYQEDGYSVSGTFELLPLTSCDDLLSLPLNRTFVEG